MYDYWFHKRTRLWHYSFGKFPVQGYAGYAFQFHRACTTLIFYKRSCWLREDHYKHSEWKNWPFSLFPIYSKVARRYLEIFKNKSTDWNRCQNFLGNLFLRLPVDSQRKQIRPQDRGQRRVMFTVKQTLSAIMHTVLGYKVFFHI